MKVADRMSNKADSLATVEQPSAIFLKQQLNQTMAEARHICAEWGWAGKKCVLAWERVENLQAEETLQQTEELKQTAFDEYCQKHPEAKEVIRGYDPWFCHWSEEEPFVGDN